MRSILVYGDSLSWGLVPFTRERQAFEDRWPVVMEKALLEKGLECRVINHSLNGRRTAWEDSFKKGRNGLLGIGLSVESASPLDLLVILLGTNDFQVAHNNNAFLSSQGVDALITEVRKAPVEPGMPVPEILVIARPPFKTSKGSNAMYFKGAQENSRGLAEAYRKVCQERSCHFFDAGTVVEASDAEGVHFEKEGHHILGNAVAAFAVKNILKQ